MRADLKKKKILDYTVIKKVQGNFEHSFNFYFYSFTE